jgi:hypothetical protein
VLGLEHDEEPLNIQKATRLLLPDHGPIEKEDVSAFQNLAALCHGI